MGGGKHTTQSNVTKKPRNYSDNNSIVGAGGTGGWSGFDKEASVVCLISFKAKIQLSVEEVEKGASFKLLPTGNASSGLQLISGGRRLGEYKGNRLSLLDRCIAGGYSYGGIVDQVGVVNNALVASCTITGSGPV